MRNMLEIDRLNSLQEEIIKDQKTEKKVIVDMEDMIISLESRKQIDLQIEQRKQRGQTKRAELQRQYGELNTKHNVNKKLFEQKFGEAIEKQTQ